MKRYQILLGLLIAGMIFSFSLPVKGSSTIVNIELAEVADPTPEQCKVLRAAAEAVQVSYQDLYNGYVKGDVQIAELSEDHYCVVYGTGANDFIILNLEEE